MAITTPDSRRWIALGLLCATQFMLVIDVSIINVALPTIQKALDFSTSNLQWVASGYALTFGGFLLLGGRAADLLGRRRMFMVGLLVFVIASLACGFASSSGFLIAARAVQGLGAALVAPAALSILTTTFAEGVERNKALAVWGAVSGAGGAVGVLLGGVFTEYLGWEWVFYVNVPIGLIAIALAPRLLRESRVEGAARNFDAAGAIIVTAALSLLVYTLVETDTNHWLSATTIGLFAISAVLLIIFVAIEKRTAHPLLPLSIFRLRTLTGANVVGFLLGASLFSMFFLLALYMQSPDGLGYSPLRSGFGYLLVAISIIVSAGASQAIVSKVGVPKVMGAGLAMLTAGLLWFTQVSPHGSYLVDLAPGFLLAGFGLGFSFIPVTIAALEGITDRQAGLASGLINTSQQIGGALGVALLTTVLTNYTLSHASPTAGPEVFTEGLSRAFLVGAGLAFIAFIANLVLVRESTVEPVAAAPETAEPARPLS
jgi:EmrB/QacA subfamily drug resistance transporter